ncbi:MAG: hypothetical protein ACTSUE_06040 [Promethearchaeota archaeon]
MVTNESTVQQEKSTSPTKPGKKKKKKRLRGFARTIKSLMDPLNEYPRFKEKFADADLKIMLVAKDYPPAALIIIKGGTVKIEGVSFEDIKSTKKNGMLKATLDNIMALAIGKLKPIKAAFTGKIKVRGVKNLLKLNIAFYYMGKLAKEKKEAMKASAGAKDTDAVTTNAGAQ